MWVVNDSGKVVYSTGDIPLELQIIERIKNESGNDSQISTYKANPDGKAEQTLFSYNPITLHGVNFGLIFSSPVGIFKKFLLKNSVIHTFDNTGFILATYMLWKRLVFRTRRLKAGFL